MNKEERLLKLEEENRRLKAFIEEYFKDLSTTYIPYIDGPGFWEEMAEDGLYDYKEMLKELEEELSDNKKEKEPKNTFSSINWYNDEETWGGGDVLYTIEKSAPFGIAGECPYYKDREDMARFFELLQLDHENEVINNINYTFGTLQYKRAKSTKENVAGIMIYENTEDYSPRNAYTVTIWSFEVTETGEEVTPQLVRWSQVPKTYFEELSCCALEFLAASVVEQSLPYGGEFREFDYSFPRNLLLELESVNLLRDVDATCYYHEDEFEMTRLDFVKALPDCEEILSRTTNCFNYLNPFDNYAEQYAYIPADKIDHVKSYIFFY